MQLIVKLGSPLFQHWSFLFSRFEILLVEHEFLLIIISLLLSRWRLIIYHEHHVLEYSMIRLHEGSNVMGHALSKWRYRAWLRRVAALEHADHASLTKLICYFHQLFSSPLVLKLGNFGIPWWMNVIFLMSVKASGHKNHIWSKSYQLRNDLRRKNLAPLARSCRSRHEWIIVNTTWLIDLLACTLAASIGIKAIAVQMNWLEKYVLSIILVEPRPVLSWLPGVAIPKNRRFCWFTKHLWLLHAFNYFLSTIAVMHVNVHNRHSFDLLPVGIFHVCCSNCNIVYIAKSISLFLITNIIFESLAEYTRVMSRRPDCTESIPILRSHDLITCFNDSTTCLQGCIPCICWNMAIIIVSRCSIIIFSSDPFEKLFTFMDNTFDIAIVVYPQNVCYGRGFTHLFDSDSIIVFEFPSFCQSARVLINENHEPFCILWLVILLHHSFLHICVVLESCMLQACFISDNESFFEVIFNIGRVRQCIFQLLLKVTFQSLIQKTRFYLFNLFLHLWLRLAYLAKFVIKRVDDVPTGKFDCIFGNVT